MVDEVRARAVRRRARVVVAGDTTRLFGLVASRSGRAGRRSRTEAARPQHLVPAVTGPRRVVRVGRRGRLVLVDTVEPAPITAMAGRGAGAPGPARLARRVLALGAGALLALTAQETATDAQWLHLATASAIWALLPAAVGAWRVQRSEIG